MRTVCSYSEFEHKMQVLKYKIIKGRGISFIDDKKVKIKGSEVGFSLAKIEKILSVRQELLAKQEEQKIYETTIWQDTVKLQSITSTHKILQPTSPTAPINHSPFIPIINELSSLLELLLRAENTSNYLPFELTEEGLKQRRKKQRYRNRGTRL